MFNNAKFEQLVSAFEPHINNNARYLQEEIDEGKNLSQALDAIRGGMQFSLLQVLLADDLAAYPEESEKAVDELLKKVDPTLRETIRILFRDISSK